MASDAGHSSGASHDVESVTDIRGIAGLDSIGYEFGLSLGVEVLGSVEGECLESYQRRRLMTRLPIRVWRWT